MRAKSDDYDRTKHTHFDCAKTMEWERAYNIHIHIYVEHSFIDFVLKKIETIFAKGKKSENSK